MPGLERFTFNGLKGADLVIFNLLAASEGRIPLSHSEIAKLTCYSPTTVYRSIKRLRTIGIVESRRAKRGQRYQHIIKENYGN